MSDHSKLRACVFTHHWSGHGEGGSIASLAMTGGYRGDAYNSTQSDLRALQEEVAYINRALDAYAAWQKNLLTEADKRRVAPLVETFFEVLPRIPDRQWHRLSFDLVQDPKRITVSFARFYPIEESAADV